MAGHRRKRGDVLAPGGVAPPTAHDHTPIIPEPEPSPPADLYAPKQPAPESSGPVYPLHGPVAALLRRELQAQVDVREHAKRLLAFCAPPGPDATAADRRVALDAVIYVTNQLIGAPRQALEVTSDDRRTIMLTWGQPTAAALAEVIEGEVRLVEEDHARECRDADAPTSNASAEIREGD